MILAAWTVDRTLQRRVDSQRVMVGENQGYRNPGGTQLLNVLQLVLHNRPLHTVTHRSKLLPFQGQAYKHALDHVSNRTHSEDIARDYVGVTGACCP